MNSLSKAPEIASSAASLAEVDVEDAGQRLDNFLVRHLKGVPKSHVYRLLRTGQVRVNSGRVEASYRLRTGDRVRIPPVRVAAPARADRPAPRRPATDLSAEIILEDDWLLAIDKPAGLAVHGGSGVSRGVIELLRAARPGLRFLELVHRLDRDTSGVLLLAKKRSALTDLHAQLRAGTVEKRYRLLVVGAWREPKQSVELPLTKYVTEEGERRVSVEAGGLPSHTVFTLEKRIGRFSLLSAELKTGRTHQIRVSVAHLGFPIAGDDKYGDFALNRQLAKQGLKRMFLHAASLAFRHPGSAQRIELSAPLPADLAHFRSALEHAEEPE
jgi:23S rRNA pseudouridine955/2504/2580 synthase